MTKSEEMAREWLGNERALNIANLTSLLDQHAKEVEEATIERCARVAWCKADDYHKDWEHDKQDYSKDMCRIMSDVGDDIRNLNINKEGK